jgi:hypothetical protein
MQGKVKTLNLWKGNTKGFFMRVDNKEYTAFGIPTVQVGDEISFEENGMDKFGKCTLAKNIKKLDAEVYFNKSMEKNRVAMDILAGKPPTREEAIERLALLKMATRIVCAQIKNGVGVVDDQTTIANRIRNHANALKGIL